MNSSNTPQNATASRRGGKSKPSMLKRLKKLVRGSPAGLPQPQPEASTSTFEHQRRAEALRTCGLLKQSVKYGAPYHDDEDDARTVISPSEQRWGQDTEDKKDLINFGEKVSHVSKLRFYQPELIEEVISIDLSGEGE